MNACRRCFGSFLSLLLFALFAAPATAQTSTAALRGRVTDADGAPIAKAEINAVDSRAGIA